MDSQMGNTVEDQAVVTESPMKSAEEMAAQVWRTSRRTMMCGVLGVSAAGVLAACSSGPDDSAGTDAGTADEGDGSADGGDSGDGSASDALAKVSDIPVGGGIAAGGMVLVQPEEGKVLAFDGACPHKGTQLPAPQDGTITCPSHGSQFKAEDGSLQNGPATTGLTEVKLTVKDGEVFKA
jgi:Rieske Fe-S protein